MANYIDGKEDSTLNQRNDKLLETPQKCGNQNPPNVELPTVEATTSLINTSLPNDISQPAHTSTPLVSRDNIIPSILSIEDRFRPNSAHFFTVREPHGILPLPIRLFALELCDDGVLDLSKRTGRNFRSYQESNQIKRCTNQNNMQTLNQPSIVPQHSWNIELQPYQVNDLSTNRRTLPADERIIDLSVTSNTPYFSNRSNAIHKPTGMICTSSQTSPTLGSCSFCSHTESVATLDSQHTTLEVSEPIALVRALNQTETHHKCNPKRVGDQLNINDSQLAAKRILTNETAAHTGGPDVDTDEEIDILTLDATDTISTTAPIIVSDDVNHKITVSHPSTIIEEVTNEPIKTPLTNESPSEEWMPTVQRHISIEPPKAQRQNLQVQFNNSPTTEHVKEPQPSQSNNDQRIMECETSTIRPNIGSIAKNIVFVNTKSSSNASTSRPIIKFDLSSLNNPSQPVATDHNFNWSTLLANGDHTHDGENSCDEDVISIFAPSIR